MIPFLSAIFNRSHTLDVQFTAYLKEKFGIAEETTREWRYVGGSTTLASKKVKLFRIYDPAAMAVPSNNVSFKALAEMPDVVKFEGQVSNTGIMGQIRDVRVPATS